MRVSAVRCVTAGDSAEASIAFGCSRPPTGGRAQPSASLCGRIPCTHSKLRTLLRKYEKPPPAAQLSREPKDLRQEVTL